MIVNGEKIVVEVKSINKLLKHLEISLENVVVEVNGNILSKKIYDDRILNDDDKIEIISFVGGG